MGNLIGNTLDYDTEQRALDRKRALALRRMQTADAQVNAPTDMLGEVAVRKNPLATVGQALLSGYGRNQLDDYDKEQSSANNRRAQGMSDAAAALYGADPAGNPEDFGRSVSGALNAGVPQSLVSDAQKQYLNRRNMDRWMAMDNDGAPAGGPAASPPPGMQQPPPGAPPMPPQAAPPPRPPGYFGGVMAGGPPGNFAAGGSPAEAPSVVQSAPVPAPAAPPAARSGAVVRQGVEVPRKIQAMLLSGDPAAQKYAEAWIGLNKPMTSGGISFSGNGQMVAGVINGVPVQRGPDGLIGPVSIPGLNDEIAKREFAQAQGKTYGAMPAQVVTGTQGGSQVTIPLSALPGVPPPPPHLGGPQPQRQPAQPAQPAQPRLAPDARGESEQKRLAILQEEYANQLATGQVDPNLLKELRGQQERMGYAMPRPAAKPQVGLVGTPTDVQAAKTDDAKEAVKTVYALREQAVGARQQLDLADAYTASAPKTGQLAPMRSWTANMISAFGFDPEKLGVSSASDIQQLRGIQGSVLLATARQLPGSFTEREGDAVRGTFAQVNNLPESNDFLVSFMKARARRIMKAQAFADQYMAAHDGDARGWQQAISTQPWYTQSVFDDPVLAKWQGAYKANLERMTQPPQAQSTAPVAPPLRFGGGGAAQSRGAGRRVIQWGDLGGK